MPIDVPEELDSANKRLAINVDRDMPLDITLRTIALTIAQRHVGDTCVKEGSLYQQLKMDNKLGNVVSLDDVIRTALVMERYLWGEWSKGIAENAINSISTAAADVIEEMMEQKIRGGDDDPSRPAAG